MSRVKRRMAIVLVFVLLVCVLSGCRQKRTFHLQPSTKHTLRVAGSTADDIDDNDPTVTPVITSGAYNLIAVHYYSVDASNSNVKNATVMERDDIEITPELILDYLIDSLADESVSLSYNSIDVNNGSVVIDFDNSIVNISETNAELEFAVLDAVAQSILDNIDGCKSITYHINGGAYKTDNLSFGFNDIYMDDE